MARRSNSMQVRRRQSDAKWRASVANCYTTLKIITSISSGKKKSKRKFSKAHILQETVNYISYLESTLSTYLDEKCNMIESGSLPNTNHAILRIEQVRQEFSAKQTEIFANGLTMRKCSSSLDDLLNEAFEVNSTVLSTPGTTLNETPIFENISSEESKNEYLENYQAPKKWILEIENDSTGVLSPIKKRKLDYTYHHEVSSTSLSSSSSASSASSLSSAACRSKETPFIGAVNHFSKDSLKTEMKIEKKNLFETPKKQTEISEKKAKDNQPTSGSRLLIRPLTGGNSLFTPLKSPPVFDLCISPIATPYRMQLSNYLTSDFVFSTPENEPETTFTFHESIDIPDSVTPGSKSLKINSSKNDKDKHGTTCRKRLDKLFTESKSEQDVSFDLGMHRIANDSLDFDGYFLVYKQFVEEIQNQSPNNETAENSELARNVSRMWSTLPAKEKNMLMAMAALEKKESQDLKLTDDLRNLDVQKVLDIDDIDDAHLFNKNDDISQIIPNQHPAATATCSSSDIKATGPSFSQSIVPDICSSPFKSTSNSLSDHYCWKGSSPTGNHIFQMDNGMDISYEIIDMPTAENMGFAVTTIRSECDDGPLESIWNAIEIHPGSSFHT